MKNAITAHQQDAREKGAQRGAGQIVVAFPAGGKMKTEENGDGPFEQGGQNLRHRIFDQPNADAIEQRGAGPQSQENGSRKEFPRLVRTAFDVVNQRCRNSQGQRHRKKLRP